MAEDTPVYIVNGKRVDPNGKPVSEEVAANEAATDTGDKKPAAKSKTQTEKPE